LTSPYTCGEKGVGCVGVLGDESRGLGDDEFLSRGSRSLVLRTQDGRPVERRDEPEARESDRSCSCMIFCETLTYVAWLDAMDFWLTFDLSSWREPCGEMPEVLDLGLIKSSSTSLASLSVVSTSLSCPLSQVSTCSPSTLLSADTSVSGGVGGRADFLDLDDLRVKSDNLDDGLV